MYPDVRFVVVGRRGEVNCLDAHYAVLHARCPALLARINLQRRFCNDNNNIISNNNININNRNNNNNNNNNSGNNNNGGGRGKNKSGGAMDELRITNTNWRAFAALLLYVYTDHLRAPGACVLACFFLVRQRAL